MTECHWASLRICCASIKRYPTWITAIRATQGHSCPGEVLKVLGIIVHFPHMHNTCPGRHLLGLPLLHLCPGDKITLLALTDGKMGNMTRIWFWFWRFEVGVWFYNWQYSEKLVLWLRGRFHLAEKLKKLWRKLRSGTGCWQLQYKWCAEKKVDWNCNSRILNDIYSDLEEGRISRHGLRNANSKIRVVLAFQNNQSKYFNSISSHSKNSFNWHIFEHSLLSLSLRSIRDAYL